MSKIPKKYFKVTTRVKLSTPFISRSRCIRCLGIANRYYWVRNSALFRNPEALKIIQETICSLSKRFCSSHYLNENPSSYKSMATFKYSNINYYMTYNPKIYRTRGVKTSNYYAEFLSCNCGHTSWAFSNKTDSDRPEVLNRKSKGFFPKKYSFKY